MNTIINTSRNISDDCSFSKTKINTQVESNEQLIYHNIINQHRIIQPKNSSAQCNNTVIDKVHLSIKKLPLEKKHSTLTRKSQLHNIIINGNENPDYLAINIYYDTLRSWYTPNKMKDVDGNIITVKKLKTKGIYFSYKKLSALHGCSTETIRRKFVKLENLGLIQRSFKHRETITTKSYNQLIIYVWRHTPHFFNKYGIDQPDVGKLRPQTNHKYIAEKYDIHYHSKVEEIKAIENEKGIHKEVDTKELIESFNKSKDRSRKSNFYKNRLTSNCALKDLELYAAKSPACFTKNRVSIDPINSTDPNNLSNSPDRKQKEITGNNTSKNGFLGKGRYLEDLLEYLTDEMCNTVRSNSSREFTNKAIREIAKTVSKSKKGSKAFFYHVKGFISYLSKVLCYEKRNPVKIKSGSCNISANRNTEKKEIHEQEKYLNRSESSLKVSPEYHFKEKLASVLERSKAYNVLAAYKSLDVEGDNAVMQLNYSVKLSKMDKETILQQIQEIYEKFSGQEMYRQIKSLQIKVCGESALTTQMTTGQIKQSFSKREGVWGKIRESFAQSFLSGGDNLDKVWTSHLRAEIDSNKTINLFAPSSFISDWVNSNYRDILETLAKDNGLNLGNIDCYKK